MPDFSAYSHRLTALLHHCKTAELHALIVPASDEHLNEYLPHAWKRRDWLCGFTGSAGELLLLNTHQHTGAKPCYLFVDSRYYEQAEQEVPTALVSVSKVGLVGHPTLAEVLTMAGKQLSHSQAPFIVGVDFNTIAASKLKYLQTELNKHLPNPIHWQDTGSPHNWIDTLKQQQTPEEPIKPTLQPVISLAETLTGMSVTEKIALLRAELTKHAANILPITKLDEVAWLFNLRGTDIDYNPVFIAYGLLASNTVYLFTEQSRIPQTIQNQLQRADVTIKPYQAFWETLAGYLTKHTSTTVERTVWLDEATHTAKLTTLLTSCSSPTINRKSPIEHHKAIKTVAELQGMRLANLQASIAITETLAWLWERGQRNTPTSEKAVADFLATQYHASGASGLSFNTIAGAGANAAIVHYGTPNNTVLLNQGEWFLLDSGGQYPTLAGTTDCTRTIVFGNTPTPLMKQRYTAVLAGHIACASLSFPQGTTGATIDAICRQPLWALGLDYGHGTGHGVGAFLNVHEGPIGISKGYTTPFTVGNITSIEPGFYEAGWGGIRLENLYEVVERPALATPQTPHWLGFDSLLYIPFERALIDEALLSPQALQWLKAYSQAITEKLLPLLQTNLAKTWVQQQLF
jgi:Xaa-Pro aminopeptidase